MKYEDEQRLAMENPRKPTGKTFCDLKETAIMNTSLIKRIAIIVVLILLFPLLLKIGFYFLVFFLSLLAAGWVGFFFLKKYLQHKMDTIQQAGNRPWMGSSSSTQSTYSSKKNEHVIIDVSAERR